MWDYPRAIERDFQNSLAKENGNEDDPDSPTGQGYGDPGRAVHELRAGRQAVEADGQRWSARPESVQCGRGRQGSGPELHSQGQGALQARAAGEGAFVLRSRPRRLVAAPVADRA